VGIDDWSWTKGKATGRSWWISSDATWWSFYPTGVRLPGLRGCVVEVVSRDRHGQYAEGARDRAPRAVQVADRFHLLQNFRGRIEQQLGRLSRPFRQGASAAPEAADTKAGLHGVREELFAKVRALCDAGKTAAAICQELGLKPRTGRPVGAARAIAEACPLAGLFPWPPDPPLGGRLHPRDALTHRNQAPRLHWLLHASGSLPCPLAKEEKHERKPSDVAIASTVCAAAARS
jgi:hypothetical protein